MAKIKKILFCDIDGILLDFNAYVLPHLAKAYGVSVPEGYIPSSWNMVDLAPKGSAPLSWEKCVPPDWTLNLPSFKKARQFLNKMIKKGYYIVMVTRIGQSRQLDRINCLIKHNLQFNELYLTAHGQKKSDIIATVLKRHKPNKWIFIDDKASTCQEVAEMKRNNARIYTLDYPFNSVVRKQDPKGLIWLKNEDELYERVLEDA